jgi:integrase/recombinase XerD
VTCVFALIPRAGPVGATSQSGRRAWLTALSQKVVGVFVLADTAGYRSIQTTQYYVTVNHEMRRNAAGDCELVCVFVHHGG